MVIGLIGGLTAGGLSDSLVSVISASRPGAQSAGDEETNLMRFITILPAAVGLAGFVVLVAIVAGLDFAITGSWGLA